MDVFSRTFLPATSEAGLPIPMVSRHMPMLRRCVDRRETTMLVARCHRPGQPVAGSLFLLLTNRTLVVTRESRLSRRVQLYLAAEVRALTHVTWNPDPRLRAVELAATTVDKVRERFWIPVGDARRAWQLDALFSHVFRSRTVAPRTVPRVTPRLVSPAGAV
jgi:hypothetical protein